MKGNTLKIYENLHKFELISEEMGQRVYQLGNIKIYTAPSFEEDEQVIIADLEGYPIEHDLDDSRIIGTRLEHILENKRNAERNTKIKNIDEIELGF